ncbi:hypothetical protein C2845_PMPSC016549 [Panicum miliaceum]|uniref:Uncharacterized protein n=1 Tax=Panicum miliaceum TaxID=4540 RepID=A0A3L6PB95_PANMI|nr:hypothetical protein C2845_PMPSC016549 [Panicum miliaceum]
MARRRPSPHVVGPPSPCNACSGSGMAKRLTTRHLDRRRPGHLPPAPNARSLLAARRRPTLHLPEGCGARASLSGGRVSDNGVGSVPQTAAAPANGGAAVCSPCGSEWIYPFSTKIR